MTQRKYARGFALSAGADVNARMSNGYTALMIAAEKFEPEISRVLIAAGADVSARNNFGETALSLARKEGNDAVVAILKRAGAKE
jgi:ankyrin repeat protein